jgi:hypothetical protein
MRKDFRPKLKIRCCVEDRCLWRVHENGIGLMHEQIETAQSFNVARLLPNTASFLENHFRERENLRVNDDTCFGRERPPSRLRPFATFLLSI